MKNFCKNRGITLVEIMVIIAVIGILSAVVTSQFFAVKRLQVLKNAGEDIVAGIHKAKSQTLASLYSDNYGVHFQADKIVIFRGTVYNSGDPNNENIDIVSPATVSSITLSGGGSELYFNRLSGMPNKTGTVGISLTSDPSINKTITISATGSASLN
jgi:Tfp pilus assembly protein FimT